MSELAAQLQRNLTGVRQRIDAAAERAGRDPAGITLVAVTKYATTDIVQKLVELGCHDLGESRPQELWRKAEQLSDPRVRWHMVGHLQRNKARRTLPLVHLLHSVDSLELLADIDKLSAARPSRVLIEVNVSGDTTKHGIQPDEVHEFVRQALRFRHVHIAGLMTMAAREGDLQAARENFRDLRELRDRTQADFGERIALTELSMGMSEDFEVAIEEGATLVRVGSSLFAGIAT